MGTGIKLGAGTLRFGDFQFPNTIPTLECCSFEKGELLYVRPVEDPPELTMTFRPTKRQRNLIVSLAKSIRARRHLRRWENKKRGWF